MGEELKPKAPSSIEDIKERLKVHDINYPINGLTLLHIVCYGRRADLVKFLLDNNANPDIKDTRGFTSLAIACRKVCPEIVKLLVEAKADTNIPYEDEGYEFYPLHISIMKEDLLSVRALLDGGANPNTAVKGFTPLMFACFNNKSPDIALSLIYNNANIHVTVNGEKAMDIAIRNKLGLKLPKKKEGKADKKKSDTVNIMNNLREPRENDSGITSVLN